ncbi:MAG TPA: serine/threonine-protein kinase, partial [Longimicrobiaceae bacterium]
MSITPHDLHRRFHGLLLGGRYRLDELVGHGGMGAVFRATDERLDRQVAVKVIWVDAEDPAERERHRQRFTREARLAARIRHMNVVTVHDFGTDVEPNTGRELDYIVMELLSGQHLAEWLPRFPRDDLALQADILAQAARGVAAGHRAGIVHRDVKPRNLMVDPDDAPGRVVVRVVDFSIAKSHTSTAEFGEITIGNGFIGSARYASPEQLRGNTELAPASDVFSLGVVAYEVLAGQHPFDDGDRTRLSQGLHVRVRSPRVHNPAIPELVERVILRSLEIEPAERYPDAAALGTALEAAWRAAAASPASAPDDVTLIAVARTQEDATILQDVAVAAPAPVPVPEPEPVPVDRRQTPPAPRPPRWRPGVATWAAAVALAGVIAVAGLAVAFGDGSLVKAVTGFLRSGAPRELRPGAAMRGELERGDSALASGMRFDVYRFRGEVGRPLTLALDSAAFDGAIEWGRVRDGEWKTLESSAGIRPARIAVTVADTAEYRVRVRALRLGGRGRYRL